MRLNPPLREAPRYPVSSLVSLAATAASLYWWSGADIGVLLPSGSLLLRQPWRLVTSALPHVNLVHLAFNLTWWWPFATRLERAWGPARLILITLLLAVSSSAAEFALFGAGVGLSGVVYGLCGLLYFAQRGVPALQGAVSQKTAGIFAVWFLLCIVLTATNIMPVANVAHAAGAVVGIGIGMFVLAAPNRRPAWGVAVGLLTLATLLGATIARPWINLARSGSANAYLGYQALSAGRVGDALRYLEAAVDEQPRNADAWTNLGIAYQDLNRLDDALRAYERTVAIDSSQRSRLAPSIAWILNQRARDALVAADLQGAKAAAEEALRWTPADTLTWRILGTALARAGDIDAGLSAYERAQGLATPEQRASAAFRAQVAEEIGVLEANALRHGLAADRFREALSDDPQNGRLWLLLAHELEAAGSLDHALDAYDQAATFAEQAKDAKARAEAIRKAKSG